MSKPKPVLAQFLGQVEYAEAFEMQSRTRSSVQQARGADVAAERLFLLEHPPVFTLGRNADRSDIRAGAEWLDERGIEVAETDRGGQVTYHGPGQLVGYPVMDLDPDRRDLRLYIRSLQEVLIRVLAAYGVEAHARTEQHEIGVWVGEGKVASLGVHVSRWVTTHGFALNVTTDLGHFGGIVACGLPDVQMTSVEQLTGQRPALLEVARQTATAFGEVFERPVEWSESLAFETP